MKRDVRGIPLIGEMSQSDKRVAVFAEKPSPTAIEEMFDFNFVGDGFLHVPKRFRYIKISLANNLFPNNTYYYKSGA